MEDPVTDRCGHTFERKAILDWLELGEQQYKVCPISRKPMTPIFSNDEPLKARIQEWKLDHPMYQGADRNYAKRQIYRMLNKCSGIGHNYNDGIIDEHDYDNDGNNNNGDDDDNISHTNSSSSYNNNNNNNINTRSRFELMLLPQERQVLKIVKIRAKLRQERVDRSRCVFNCMVLIGIATLLLIAIAIFVAVMYKNDAVGGM